MERFVRRNHDVPRINSKWGDTENFWRESSTSIATMYFLMQGSRLFIKAKRLA